MWGCTFVSGKTGISAGNDISPREAVWSFEANMCVCAPRVFDFRHIRMVGGCLIFVHACRNVDFVCVWKIWSVRGWRCSVVSLLLFRFVGVDWDMCIRLVEFSSKLLSGFWRCFVGYIILSHVLFWVRYLWGSFIFSRHRIYWLLFFPVAGILIRERKLNSLLLLGNSLLAHFHVKLQSFSYNGIKKLEKCWKIIFEIEENYFTY